MIKFKQNHLFSVSKFKQMKKIIVLAVSAFLVSGVAFAHNEGGKKKEACKDKKECCKKGTKDACKKDDKKDEKKAKKA